jgi:hypothetical protein
MIPDEAGLLVRRLRGFWPSPPMTPEEEFAWVSELTDPHLAISTEEALTVLARMSRSGEPFRPRIGQVVDAVRALRRVRVAVLQSGLQSEPGDDIAPPEVVAGHLAEIRAALAPSTPDERKGLCVREALEMLLRHFPGAELEPDR